LNFSFKVEINYQKNFFFNIQITLCLIILINYRWINYKFHDIAPNSICYFINWKNIKIFQLFVFYFFRNVVFELSISNLLIDDGRLICLKWTEFLIFRSSNSSYFFRCLIFSLRAFIFFINFSAYLFNPKISTN